jgi:hypothetical protein
MLACLSGESCPVYIEPYGYELTLLAGERFWVESWAVAAGTLDIGYVPDGIWLGFDPLDAWVVSDLQGVERMRFDPVAAGLALPGEGNGDGSRGGFAKPTQSTDVP